MAYKVGTKEYIGDGVYAYYDGYQIWLEVDRFGVKHEIALEPPVFKNLLAFEAMLNRSEIIE